MAEGNKIGPGSKYARLVLGVRKLQKGQVYVATQGHDFTCLPESFRTVVHAAAASKTPGNWKATTSIVGRQVFFAYYEARDYMKPNMPAMPLVRKARGEA